MILSVFLSYIAISTVNIVTPGPANINTVHRAVQFGAVRVMPTIFGNALGLAVGGVLCAIGASAIVASSGVLWTAFQWLGVGYLGWLGIKLFSTRVVVDLSAVGVQSVAPRGLFREAFLLAATNPKALLFFLSIFPQFIAPPQSVALQFGLMILSYCGLSILSLSSYALCAQALSQRYLTQFRYDVFRRVSGAILICFAISLAVS